MPDADRSLHQSMRPRNEDPSLDRGREEGVVSLGLVGQMAERIEWVHSVGPCNVHHIRSLTLLVWGGEASESFRESLSYQRVEIG